MRVRMSYHWYQYTMVLPIGTRVLVPWYFNTYLIKNNWLVAHTILYDIPYHGTMAISAWY